jgi:transketolase
LVGEELRKRSYDIRIVSMPSQEIFFEQPKEFRDVILPPDAKVFTIEAGSTLGWYKIASRDCAIGIDRFGVSGQSEQVLHELEFDFQSILNKILERLKK